MTVQKPNWLLRFINPKNGMLDSHAMATLQQMVNQTNTSTTDIATLKAAPQSRVLLNTLTASASATLSDTTSLTATYSAYELLFNSLVPASSAVQFILRVHSGGSFQSGGSYVRQSITDVTASTATTSTGVPLSDSATSDVVNSPTIGVCGVVRVYQPSDTSKPTLITVETFYPDGATSLNIIHHAGYWNSNAAVDGFQVLFGSGNIASGTIKVYGIT